MRKILGLFIIVAMGVFAVTAVAGKNDADKATGSGTNNPHACDPPNQSSAACNEAMADFDINAKSAADGTAPSGTVKFTKHLHPDRVVEGKVVCLTVHGNLAGIGVDISKLKNTSTDPGGLLVYVQANGKKSGAAAPDKIQSIATAEPPTSCEPVVPDTNPIKKGNLKTRDDNVNFD